MAKDIKKSFGNRVRQLRQSRDWSQERAGEACDLHWTYIGQVERGERNISLESIHKIAKGFKVELAELFQRVR